MNKKTFSKNEEDEIKEAIEDLIMDLSTTIIYEFIELSDKIDEIMKKKKSDKNV